MRLPELGPRRLAAGLPVKEAGRVRTQPRGRVSFRVRWRLVQGEQREESGLRRRRGVPDAAAGLRAQASGHQRHPPDSSRPRLARPGPAAPQALPRRGPQTAARGRGGARRLNHLSLCSSQLNGSGQLKMSSHCLSAQMLAPPPPGLPRLALPPATKPTSEGGSTSPTSPCKHSGSGARGRAGVPEGPPPLPSPTAGAQGSGPACRVLVSLVGPQTEAHRGPRQP